MTNKLERASKPIALQLSPTTAKFDHALAKPGYYNLRERIAMQLVNKTKSETSGPENIKQARLDELESGKFDFMISYSDTTYLAEFFNNTAFRRVDLGNKALVSDTGTYIIHDVGGKKIPIDEYMDYLASKGICKAKPPTKPRR